VQRRVVLSMVATALVVVACNPNDLDQDGDGFTVLTNDCDDTDPNVHPDAVEVCYNGIDDNCNGVLDEEGATSGRVWYVDLDGDGYGNETVTIEACEQPENYAANKWDCNESDPEINPGAAELCDYIDNDCDGQVDEDTSEDALTWYPDRDGDGYGDTSNPFLSCEAPAGYVADGGDCGDLDPLQNPDAIEDCRTDADDDCDGSTNGEGAYGCRDFYADLDGDGFPGTVACLCVAEAPYTATEATDCDDERADIYPGAVSTRRFAVEDCNADARVDTTTADHELDIGGYTYGRGAALLDATGDGIDDLLAASIYRQPALLEGPVTAHADLESPLMTLPWDTNWVGQYSLQVIADQDGDGLEDVMHYFRGSDPARSGVYAYSSAARGALSLEDALWHVPSEWASQDVRVFPADGSAPVELLITERYSDTIEVLELPGMGAEPVVLGRIEDPTGSGRQVLPMARLDLNGDGLLERVIRQEHVGFLSTFPWAGSSAVYGPRVALLVAEPWSADEPLDLEPIHVVYGWSQLGSPYGSLVTRDVDGDGLPDLLVGETSWALETNSGALWTFTADSMLDRESAFSLMIEADAIYSGAEDNQLLYVQDTADLDGDGEPGVAAWGAAGDVWLLDRFPSGHHSLRTIARPMDRMTVMATVGDGNADGIDDLLVFDGDHTLRFFWGELP